MLQRIKNWIRNRWRTERG